MSAADRQTQKAILERLESKEVLFPEGRDGVRVGAEVDLDCIEPGAIIHRGCIVEGSGTILRAGSEIGLAGGGCFRDVGLGRGASIQQGYAEGAVILSGSAARGGVEIRPATLIEEDVVIAQCVGLKMTIVLAHARFGSLINFCDALIQAGIDQDHYTEIGSGAINFNNSPMLIKYPSLIGTVESLFHRSALIFVGGMSKLIAPVSIGAGSVIAAGSRVTRNVGPDTLHFDPGKPISLPARREGVRGAEPKLRTVIEYLANVAALRDWYSAARIPLAEDALEARLLKRALGLIEDNLRERFRWVGLLMEKGGLGRKGDPVDRLTSLLAFCEESAEERLGFVAEALATANGVGTFQDRVRRLPEATTARGIAALRAAIEYWRTRLSQALLGLDSGLGRRTGDPGTGASQAQRRMTP